MQTFELGAGVRALHVLMRALEYPKDQAAANSRNMICAMSKRPDLNLGILASLAPGELYPHVLFNLADRVSPRSTRELCYAFAPGIKARWRLSKSNPTVRPAWRSCLKRGEMALVLKITTL